MRQLLLAVLLAVPTHALSPAAKEFLKEAGLDPVSADVRAADADGTILAPDCMGKDNTDSLESLARQKKKNGVIRFVTTRAFISRLKKNFDSTQMPAENYDASFLTEEEPMLVRKKTGVTR